MSLRDSSAETKTVPSKNKCLQFLKLPAPLSKLVDFYKILPFIWGLIVSYNFIENSVTSVLMDYLTSSWKEKNLPKAAIITNLQDGLSCVFAVIVSLISEAYTGRFTMITFCSSASVMGLMLLWISATSTTSKYVMTYVAISLISLGVASGRTVLEDFFYYQLDEKVRAKEERKPEHDNTDNETKEDHNMDNIKKQVHIATIILWHLGPWCFGYTTTVVFFFVVTTQWLSFKFAALFMGGTYLFFYFGYALYSQEKLPAESNLGKIYRICKVASRNRKFRYPTSDNGYTWKDYKQNHFYEDKHAKVLRLLPRVPLFTWLDKAGIVREGKEGEHCTVKEVSEVKSVALLICWGCTFFAYSLVVASGNTFFVEQASNLRPVSHGNHDIPLLFVLKNVVSDTSRFLCWLIDIAFRRMKKRKMTGKFKRIYATIIKIVIGMVCALLCCVVAWQVEAYRLDKIKKDDIHQNPDETIAMSTVALVPQFSLLGIAEGLAEGGLQDLFHGYASKSMWTFDEAFSQLVIGIGKLLTIPCVLIFKSWFKKSANTSHLDRYYLMLAVLNSVFLLGFAFYYLRYAYGKEYPEDEEIMGEPRSERAHRADSEEANSTEDSSQERSDEIVPI